MYTCVVNDTMLARLLYASAVEETVNMEQVYTTVL